MMMNLKCMHNLIFLRSWKLLQTRGYVLPLIFHCGASAFIVMLLNYVFKEVRSCYFQSYKFFLLLQQISFSILIWNSKKNRGSPTFFAHIIDMRRRMRVAKRTVYLLNISDDMTILYASRRVLRRFPSHPSCSYRDNEETQIWKRFVSKILRINQNDRRWKLVSN